METFAVMDGVPEAPLRARAYPEIEKLHSISQALVHDFTLQDILQRIVGITAELMQSRICSILLLDESKGELAIAATQSLSQAYCRKPAIKVNQGISGRAVRTQQAQIVPDVRVEQAYCFQDIARQEGVVSLLCVPMMVRNRVVGILNSYSSQPHAYSEMEVKLLSMVASQAAVAIENARLRVATAAIQQDLETRKLVERAKGLLMAENGYSEPEAFRYIQKQSMNTRRPMRKIAESILAAAESKSF